MSKVYGYVIINKETGEQWGRAVYNRKNGAANAYNHVHNSFYQRENQHKFSEQDVYGLRELVLKDE